MASFRLIMAHWSSCGFHCVDVDRAGCVCNKALCIIFDLLWFVERLLIVRPQQESSFLVCISPERRIASISAGVFVVFQGLLSCFFFEYLFEWWVNFSRPYATARHLWVFVRALRWSFYCCPSLSDPCFLTRVALKDCAWVWVIAWNSTVKCGLMLFFPFKERALLNEISNGWY